VSTKRRVPASIASSEALLAVQRSSGGRHCLKRICRPQAAEDSASSAAGALALVVQLDWRRKRTRTSSQVNDTANGWLSSDNIGMSGYSVHLPLI